MFVYKDAEAAKWAERPLGSKLLCERLVIQYEDYQNGPDEEVNAFLDLLAEIPFAEKVASLQEGMCVLSIG